mmetsp:Transcript_23763/g.38127  ORF Transcript_23763/g.38127 Transcript_23763/m.38127 type:complete len:255 (-) Transcript_23763:640-1404(-)
MRPSAPFRWMAEVLRNILFPPLLILPSRPRGRLCPGAPETLALLLGGTAALFVANLGIWALELGKALLARNDIRGWDAPTTFSLCIPCPLVAGLLLSFLDRCCVLIRIILMMFLLIPKAMFDLLCLTTVSVCIFLMRSTCLCTSPASAFISFSSTPLAAFFRLFISSLFSRRDPCLLQSMATTQSRHKIALRTPTSAGQLLRSFSKKNQPSKTVSSTEVMCSCIFGSRMRRRSSSASLPLTFVYMPVAKSCTMT